MSDHRRTVGLTAEEVEEWVTRDPEGYYAAVDRTAIEVVDQLVRDTRSARRRRFWARVLRPVRKG